MRIGVPIILFVVVAGFNHAISASLESDESNESSEEREFSETSTTPQPDVSQFAAAHVKDDIIRTTHMDGAREAVANNTDLSGRSMKEAYEKGSDEESEETEVLVKEDDDGETEAQTHAIGENTGSDESVETDSDENTSQEKTDHSEQAEDSVKSAEDVTEEEFNGFYHS